MGEIFELLQYEYVRNALIAGVLIALCSSLLGVNLVLKRLSFIGDGLSHVAFGALAIASVLKITNNLIVVLPVTVACAVILLWLESKKHLGGDAFIAVMSVSALALGYILMNVFSAQSNVSGDVCSALFGSTLILTLSATDLVLCILLSVFVILFFVFFYNKIFTSSFDPDFYSAMGLRNDVINLLVSVFVAIVIVLAMNLVGSLLVSALIVFPALSAMKIFKSYRGVTLCSALFGVGCAFVGIIISLPWGTPVGATVVLTQALVLIVCSIIGKLVKNN